MYAISDQSPALRLEKLSLAAGQVNSVAAVERPEGIGVQFQRLQVAAPAAEPELFVSYLGSDEPTAAGGLVRVGLTAQSLPPTTSLLDGTTALIDGVFQAGDVPWVISHSSQASTQAQIQVLGAGNTLTPRGSLNGAEAGWLRSFGVHLGSELVGLIQQKENGTWLGWPVRNLEESTPVSPINLPGTIVDATAHDSLPHVYALQLNGSLGEYTLDDTFQPILRMVGTLPEGITVAQDSFARMTYVSDSVVFPGFIDGAPHLLRMRLHSGGVSAWPWQGGTFYGWSALAAGDGVVCYGDDANLVHCGCLDSQFNVVP